MTTRPSAPAHHLRPRRAGMVAAAFTAIAAAGALLSSVPAAAVPAAPTAATADPPQVLPTPQQMTLGGPRVPLSGRVTIVTGDAPDPAAVDVVRGIVTAAGGRAVVSASSSGEGKEVWLGTVQGNPGISRVVSGMGSKDATDLRPEGYVLVSGRYQDRPVIALNGVDERGTFYAAQTLRQLVQAGQVPGASIRDWPLMPIRGAIEGFYGIPWSHQARLDQFEFYGRHKMNTYIYTPKDDRLLRAEWRELYDGPALDRMRELVTGATANKVDFTFALSPGNDICYSSQADFDATITKFEQLRALGVRSFYIALDDIPLRFTCDSDRQKYPNTGDWHWLADAQVDYLNRIQREYLEPKGLPALQTVPTNYSGSGEDPYKGEFGERLDDDVRIQWTGEGVFSDTITVPSVTRAAQSYRTDHLYIWDNFPVNDGRRGRLFLNPLTGRAPDLYQHIDGFTSNPMIQPYASLPALAGYADYTWNGQAYDPAASMRAVLDELAGPQDSVRTALRTFADLNQSWPYRKAVVYAPELNADVDAFWAARTGGGSGGSTALMSRLERIRALPTTLTAMAQPGFASDAEPWITAASQWATALRHEVAMLEAIDAGDGVRATREYLAAQVWAAKAKQPTVDDQGGDGTVRKDVIVPAVGDGAFEAFVAKAEAEYVKWLGATPVSTPAYPATASSSMGTYGGNAVSRMVDGDLSTLYWSNIAGNAGRWVQIDLGSVKPVGDVEIHQADNDTETGDMFYNAALEYSTDGTTWSSAGTFSSSPVVRYTFDAPAQARYVRLRAAADNPGGQWVKIREFTVSPPSTAYETNVRAKPGSGAGLAFDANPATAFVAAAAPVEGAHLTANVTPARSVNEVVVVGTAAGEVQVRRGDTWTTVGALDPTAPYAKFAVDPAWQVSGVRLLFSPGSAPPEVRELIVG